MHSSRMRTVRSSSRLLPGKGCLPRGCQPGEGGICSEGCLPIGVSACWCLPMGVSAQGVSAWGVSARGCLPRGGGVCLGRYLPGGFCAGGRCIPVCTEADIPPCGQNSLHTLVIILPYGKKLPPTRLELSIL